MLGSGFRDAARRSMEKAYRGEEVKEKGEREMSKEEKICLTIQEVLVLKEWFQVVCYHSNIEERDKNLTKKLASFVERICKEKKK